MHEAQAVARELESLAASLKRDIVQWLAVGGDSEKITAAARRKQELYRELRANPKLARVVLAELDPALRSAVAAHVDAGRKLRALVTPVRSASELRVGQLPPPRALRAIYDEAELLYGIPWHVLAAINFAESRFGRVLGPSSAGALGPMQFLPATWEIHGQGGDIMDPRDSILGAARYLKSLGADHDLRGALFSYNRSEAYVDAVLAYAAELEADETAFYVYYFWRVFVATTDGDVAIA